jgi:hypothetical protein
VVCWKGETLRSLVWKGRERVGVRPERGENWNVRSLSAENRLIAQGVGDFGTAHPGRGAKAGNCPVGSRRKRVVCSGSGRLWNRSAGKGRSAGNGRKRVVAPEVGDFGTAQPVRGESSGTFSPVRGRKRRVVQPVVGENGWFAPEVGDFGTAQPVRGESSGTFGLKVAYKRGRSAGSGRKRGGYSIEVWGPFGREGEYKPGSGL